MTGALVFLLGLVVGSFLNVCIHRLPRGESIVQPRSYCPKCGKPVAWFDNIPLVSFVILRGHCRHCPGSISLRYPAVELASALVWIGSWRGTEGIMEFGISVVFLSLLLVAAATDFETGLIPDEITFVGVGAGLAASYFYPALHGEPAGLSALMKSALGAAAGGALIFVTGLAGDWIFQRESMGGGDVKLLAMAGSFLGWEQTVLTFFTAPILALPFALYQRWVKKEEIIPYGPFLSLAAAVQFCYGEALWRFLIYGVRL